MLDTKPRLEFVAGKPLMLPELVFYRKIENSDGGHVSNRL